MNYIASKNSKNQGKHHDFLNLSTFIHVARGPVVGLADQTILICSDDRPATDPTKTSPLTTAATPSGVPV